MDVKNSYEKPEASIYFLQEECVLTTSPQSTHGVDWNGSWNSNNEDFWG